MRRLGYVLGKRTLQTHLWHGFNISTSIKRYRKVTKEMNFVANRPRKDVHKNQVIYNYERSSPKDVVRQNFSVDLRRVILTDITYLYYGPVRTPIYLCAFRDAYTKRILGYCVSSCMAVSLIKSAYDATMENHRYELRGAVCVIHSNQDSQYLSTTSQRLLSDDGSLQPVSDRGNPQDNASTESSFGWLKCELLNLVALCLDASTVSRMISGYTDAYNHRHYQYALAGLTPSGYYTYVTTGIYPVNNYYDIKATEFTSIQALIATRHRAAEERAKKYREASAKKCAMVQGKKEDPELVIARDQHILRHEVAKWTRSKKLVLQQTSHLREILELSQKVRVYLVTASADLILQLYNGENWGAYPKLAHIYEMRKLF